MVGKTAGALAWMAAVPPNYLLVVIVFTAMRSVFKNKQTKNSQFHLRMSLKKQKLFILLALNSWAHVFLILSKWECV